MTLLNSLGIPISAQHIIFTSQYLTNGQHELRSLHRLILHDPIVQSKVMEISSKAGEWINWQLEKSVNNRIRKDLSKISESLCE